MKSLAQFATTESTKGDIFTALGIDWKTLILQIVAFLLLVWLLAKFVYPWLMKSVDERQSKIEAGAKAAEEAQKKAEAAEKKMNELLGEARTQASDIVATAKDEATAAIEAAESKAKLRAETIVANAQNEIAKDVVAARKVLHNETIDLVSQATEKILGHVVTSKVDEKVIAAALEEAK